MIKFSAIIFMMGFAFAVFKCNSQSCLNPNKGCYHANSYVTCNYCCGHDPNFTSQSKSHTVLLRNFCDDSNYDKVTINSASSIGGDWMMIWNDEFDYSTLNQSFYRPDLAWGNIDEMHPSSIIVPENIILNNGKLKQIATYDNNPLNTHVAYGKPYGSSTSCYPCPPAHYDYQVGVFSTNMAFPINSRFHSNVKIFPNPTRTWPALWLRGDRGYEIDMFEMVDIDNTLAGGNFLFDDAHPEYSLKMSYHATQYGYPESTTYPVKEEGVHYDVGGDLTNTFNNFDLIWDKWKIDWYFNSQIVHQTTRHYYIPSSWTNGQIKKYYRANPIKDYPHMASHVGQSFMVNKNFPAGNYPQRLIFGIGLRPSVTPTDVGPNKTQEMENLTIWLRANCGAIKTINSSAFLFGPDNPTRSTYEMGRIVITNAGSNVKIPIDHYAIYAATESINLMDGFSVDLGGNFFGFMSSCVTAWDHREIGLPEPEYTFIEYLPNEEESDVNEFPIDGSFNSATRHDVILINKENSFSLVCSSGTLYEVELYNMQGALIYSIYNNSTNEIEISKDMVAQGIYTAKTISPAGLNVKKLWIIK